MQVRDGMNPALPWRPPTFLTQGLVLLLLLGSVWSTRSDAEPPTPAPKAEPEASGGKEREDKAGGTNDVGNVADESVRKAQEELDAAKEALRVARSSGNTAEASDAKARVVLAQAWQGFVKARQTYTNLLKARGSVSLKTDEADKAAKETATRVKNADVALDQANANVTTAEAALNQAKDKVKTAEAALNQAKDKVKTADKAPKNPPEGNGSEATVKEGQDESQMAKVTKNLSDANSELTTAENNLSRAKKLQEEKKTAFAAAQAEASAQLNEQKLSTDLERHSRLEAFTRFDCDERLVFCLDSERGEQFGQEVSPTLHVGELLRVRIIGLATTSKEERATITLTVNHVARTESLFQPKDAKFNFLLRDAVDRPSFEILTEAELKVLDEQSVLVDFRRESLEADTKTEAETYSLPIDHGTYYLQVGLGVPFVVNGERKVVTAPLAGSSERFSVVEEDLHVGATLMVNVFPFGGRRDGQLWFCTNGCRLGDALGFQVGLKLDTDDPFDEWYAGAVFEPIAGLAISGGLALVQGQYLTQGAEDGILVNGSPETVMRFMPRPYLGFTLTPDILDTLTEARTRLSGSSL